MLSCKKYTTQDRIEKKNLFKIKISKMYPKVFYLVLFYCVNVSYTTRLPMEVFEVSTSEISHVDNKFVKHKSTTDVPANQRRGRQMEEVKVPRILYQVGVSIK